MVSPTTEFTLNYTIKNYVNIQNNNNGTGMLQAQHFPSIIADKNQTIFSANNQTTTVFKFPPTWKQPISNQDVVSSRNCENRPITDRTNIT